ncbi:MULTISPECIES: pyridoxal-phosphate dependent enzyme [Acinetobacter]|uniref:pyridoxal-phosphate dependent enzyme n=1 Tax=Acinetobacter TaxID=469 RepID=UPI0004D7BCAF|nr:MULTISPECIES: pyridoxal-phosphate dependent enzyme [Acinetobacter]KEC83127.1 serine dehydratase [Acinetobacter sp. ETR1]WEE40157.1 pyridoxal-phosphate dependent enzyme [Acinetobacter sp. TAC-1]
MLSIKTPLIQSLVLSQLNQCQVWLKMEALQPSASFKQRGISHACQKYFEQGAQRFISSSGGNAGLAVAYTGRQLGVPVTVVVPETTAQRARELIAQQGAEVIVHGASWTEANALAQSLLTQHDVFIHPFDHPLLWEGIIPMIDEVIADGVTPDAVVLSVGGGSLLSGVAAGLKKHGLAHIPIYAVETQGTASLHASIVAKQHVELDQVSGIATTLAAKKVCQNAFEVSQALEVRSLVVSDQDTVDACLKFIDDHRILVEPACGATLSVLYDQAIQFKPTDQVLVIVCGGAGITLETLQAFNG